MRIGFTAGAFDMFHIGHLNLLKNARSQCDYLIVGVNSDELITDYKHMKPVICFEERIAIVEAIRYADETKKIDSLDKLHYWKEMAFDVVFIGNDWKGHSRWQETERTLEKVGVPVIYLPYTSGISTSDIRKRLIPSAEMIHDVRREIL